MKKQSLSLLLCIISFCSVMAQSSGYENGYQWVDLGLSVKWATCNVGAYSPEGYGNYYAWGEIRTKSTYTEDNCTTYGMTLGDISGDARYDAACANWGGSWRMPTLTECQELANYCTWTWTNQEGVTGYKVISNINGNAIFLPAAGGCINSSIQAAGEGGAYWTSTPGEYCTAYGFNFRSNGHGEVDDTRNYGLTVRPVCGISSFQQEYYRNLIPVVYVPGGTFTMGATSEQGSDAYDDEKPTHQVTVSSFYMGKYEVTQAEWEEIMGYNPSCYKGLKRPVDNVSYDEAQEFCRKLSSLTGRTYRLPTEAEWEYAARGGNQSRGYKYSGSDDLNSVAWYHGNSGEPPHAVGTKRANELGLYDMSGNVWEWCSDWYGDYSTLSLTNPKGPGSGDFRVFRGGGWYGSSSRCRVSNRNNYAPSARDRDLGFRVVLVP